MGGENETIVTRASFVCERESERQPETQIERGACGKWVIGCKVGVISITL